jgi:DNA-binding transcriptional MocR family regulator
MPGIGLAFQGQLEDSGLVSANAGSQARSAASIPRIGPGPSPRIGPRELSRLIDGTAGSGGRAGSGGPGAQTGPQNRPAYAELAEQVRLLVLDGRLPVGVQLPPERELAAALRVSRTTVSAGYDLLRASGHAASRRGSGTWTSVPPSGRQVPGWVDEPAPEGVLDLVHAAPSAPPQLYAAYAAALDELPRHLPGTGYDYRGLPALRSAIAERFTERGLPTGPEQILVTSGALQAVRLALSLVVRPGDRVLVEQPGYPNALDVVRDLGARVVSVPVDPRTRTWDIDALTSASRTAPRAAYLVPDFQNPTGALMPGGTRRTVARLLARSQTLTVVDETLAELALDGRAVPRPYACHAGGQVVTVGSVSKVFWGGLRVGWLRADAATTTRLAALRSRQDLGSPTLEQLACRHLLSRLDDVRRHRVIELRTARDHLVRALTDQLPQWRVYPPPGGQVLWCELPAASSGALAAEAGALGLRLTSGSRFAASGSLESWLRLPYTRPVPDLDRAVPLLRQAWARVGDPGRGHRPAPGPSPDWVV